MEYCRFPILSKKGGKIMAFSQEDRDMIIRIDERLNNHLDHHEKYAATLTKWLIALTVMVSGLVGKLIIGLL